MDEQYGKWKRFLPWDKPGPAGLGTRQSYFPTAPTSERFRIRTIWAAGGILAVLVVVVVAGYQYSYTTSAWLGFMVLAIALGGSFWLWGNRPQGVRLRRNTMVIEYAAGGRRIHYDTIESADVFHPDRRDPPRKRQGLMPVTGWFGIYGTSEIPWYRSYVASDGPWVLIRRNCAIPVMIDPADVDGFLTLLESLLRERTGNDATAGD
jgi:hypothetical protein